MNETLNEEAGLPAPVVTADENAVLNPATATAAGDEAEPKQAERTFTQAELDAAIQKRLLKEERRVHRRVEQQLRDQAQSQVAKTEPKREAFTRSNCFCECHLIPHVFKTACGCALGAGNTFYEHANPDALCGRNDLDNCCVLTKTCWKFKTASFDLPTIAKSNRTQDAARGIYSIPFRPLPGGRDDRLRKKLNGEVVPR